MAVTPHDASVDADSAKVALVHEMLGRIADKWTLLAIDALWESGETRFTELRQRLGGVSQKMLTKTLRQMERDGLVTRRVHAVVPPRVDYKLTSLGESLSEAVCGIWLWAEKHVDDVQRSRVAYDLR
jgi:DNA-binding HxlR family transcriptional regulator